MSDVRLPSDAVSKRLKEYRFRADNAARRGSKFVVDLTPDELIALVECAEALQEARRAIGDHFAPDHCYATGPLTGSPAIDLLRCPACSFIAMHDGVMAKLEAL